MINNNFFHSRRLIYLLLSTRVFAPLMTRVLNSITRSRSTRVSPRLGLRFEAALFSDLQSRWEALSFRFKFEISFGILLSIEYANNILSARALVFRNNITRSRDSWRRRMQLDAACMMHLIDRNILQSSAKLECFSLPFIYCPAPSENTLFLVA